MSSTTLMRLTRGDRDRPADIADLIEQTLAVPRRARGRRRGVNLPALEAARLPAPVGQEDTAAPLVGPRVPQTPSRWRSEA
jgi:hypothetical protein